MLMHKAGRFLKTDGQQSLSHIVDNSDYCPSSDRLVALTKTDTLRGIWIEPADILCHQDRQNKRGIVVLPGGAIAIQCSDEGVRVCDPESACVLDADGAANLHRILNGRSGLVSVSHTTYGLCLRPGLPSVLADTVQSCTIVLDDTVNCDPVWTDRLNYHVVQWRRGGAVVWSLVVAPPALTLVADIAGTTLRTNGRPIAASDWSASSGQSRSALMAPRLQDHIVEMLMHDVQDITRFDLAVQVVTGENCLVAQLAQSLAGLPALFSTDPMRDSGSMLLDGWNRTRVAAADLACLAIEGVKFEPGLKCADPIAGLCALLGSNVLLIPETGPALPPVTLGSVAAARSAFHAQWRQRFGMTMSLPNDVQTLVTHADNVSRLLGQPITVAAPCWNFYHRIDARTGFDAGNAAWFGMGATLDELCALQPV